MVTTEVAPSNINTCLCHVVNLFQVWVIFWGGVFSFCILSVIFSSMFKSGLSLGMLPFLYSRIRNDCFCLVIYSLQVIFLYFVL